MAFPDVLFGGRLFYFRDIVQTYLPAKAQIAAAWRAGEWPAWNPLVFGGMPLLAIPNNGAFYPGNILFLVAEAPRAMTLFLLLHYPLAAATMWTYLRAEGCGPAAAAVGASAYAWSGPALSEHCLQQLLVFHAWAPLILWAGARGAPRGGAVAWALAITSGAAERLLLLVPLALALAATRGALRAALRALLTGAAVAAPAWLPVFAHAALSTDRFAGLPWSEATYDSLAPPHLLATAIPVPFLGPNGPSILAPPSGPNPNLEVGLLPLHASIYLGASVLLLAALGLTARTGLFWAVTGVVGLLLAAGRHAPLYGLLWEAAP